MYPIFSTATLVKGRDMLAFTKLAERQLVVAIHDLATDPTNMNYLAHVVGLLVGVMVMATGHRKCVFLGMTIEEVLKAQEYKKTFTIR